MPNTFFTELRLPRLWGGAKELGIVYIKFIRGAKEPTNLQNHRGGGLSQSQMFFVVSYRSTQRAWRGSLWFRLFLIQGFLF